MQYTDIYIKKQDLSLNLYYKHYICDIDSDLKHKVILLFAAVILIVIATIIKNNKEVIEEDLKNNSILPLEYHYFYYAHSEGPKWLAIKDDISVLGTAHYKSKYPDAGVKAVVVSYAIEIN